MFMVAFLSFIGMQAFAQTSITGIVTDANGEPVPGGTVRAKGFSDVGTITDLNGSYTLSVPAEATVLVFSFVGMKAQEVEIGGQTTISVTLQNEDIGIDEVVVTAYGTTKKSSFTGSVGVVKSDDIAKSSAPTFESALQGTVSGVQVNTSSGQPGGESSIAIRGMGSFGNFGPLYVIDGVPVASGNFSDIASDSYGTSSSILSSLNPQDIESISVLKDASASSLYGARAANGVILITTKKGKKGKPTQFSFSAKYGLTDIAVEMPDVLDAEGYFKLFWDHYQKTGAEAGLSGQTLADYANSSTIGGFAINPYNTLSPYDANGSLTSGAGLYWDEDWRDAVIKKGYTQDYMVSASGGGEKSAYYFSGGYSTNDGNVVGSTFDRYSTRINFDSKVKDYLNAGINTFLSFTDQDTPPGAGGGASPMNFVNQVANIYPVYAHDANGDVVINSKGEKVYSYVNATNFDFNPVALAEMDIYNVQTYRAMTSAFFQFTFFKDFKFESKPSLDYMNMYETRYYNPDHGNGASVSGRSNKYAKRDMRLNITNKLDWGHSYGDHTISTFVVQEAAKYTYDETFAGGTNFPFNGNDNLRAAGTPSGIDSYKTEKSISSYLGSASYDFANKYYFSASLRRDGSSVFGADYKWGTFYSVGASWRISEESFVSGLDWLSNLKLRASYGTSGNDNIGRYDALGLVELGYGYGGNPGLRYTQLANPSLRWEKNISYNIGLEFGLFNKVSGELEYFARESDDLITDRPLSFTTGFDDITSNVAKINNSGFELMIHSENFRTGDFSWTSDFNITSIKNEIKELSQEEIITGSKRWIVGQDRYHFYIRKWAGVDAATGEPMWYAHVLDSDGEETDEITVTKNYNTATRFEMGSALPKFTGGFQNNVTYKGIEFSFNLYFSYGGKILDYTQMDMYHAGSTPGKQLSTDMLDAWKQPGDVTDVPRFYSGNTDLGENRSSRYLHDGSYIRLKNVTLAYNFPKSILEKAKIASLRAFISAENYFTFAKYKNIDPEVGVAGTTNNYYPHIKTLMFGLNLNF